MPLKGRSFGQERPPLTDLLKNILLRYPDGGQILKEIIQNADDAGASEVRFLFDATSYGTSSLVSPGLACFQGPALYCYNNAVFTEEDWEGLQSLMRSKKKDNPLKVGRFGIGFNSVYHITDLPSIVSGETVAFLDPHEKYFVRGQPGQAFSTSDPLLAENYDQFEPFHKIFDCNLSQGNSFHGTLFRFPLRTEPSQLSNKLYTKAMVQSLFESFKNEASVILHFLKTVDCISLYEREDRGEHSHLYTIKISEKTKSEVHKKRKELTANITPDWNFASKSVFYTLEIEEQRQRKASQKKKWFIANQVGTENEELAALGKELQLLPWVGVSFPVDTKDLAEFSGRIFCFLPLPPDADCRTGLPVQVNGYFGLTDNRRALKWPGPDCLNDDTARWNQLLMREVGSRVYASLIKNLILSGPVVPELASHAQLVYSAFPQIRNVKQDWHCLLEQFCREVLTEAIFYTAAHNKAKWIRLAEAIVDRMDDPAGTSKEVKEVVLSTLLRAGQPVVTLPRHVLEIVDVYSRKFGCVTVGKVTPHLLRDVLRRNDPRNSSMSVQEKLLLLEYVLQDTPGDSADLHGVPLLPLENEEFCKFQHFAYSSSSVRKIFVPSEKHKVELLPNAKHFLLRDDLPRGLKQKMIQLIGITHPSCFPTQLFHLARNDVMQLLWQSLPADWSTDQQTVAWSPGKKCHPSITWLQMVWVWLADQYPTNISEFERMPLIPVSFDSHGTRLARLSRNSTVILAKHSILPECLPPTVQQFLTACGCVVVQQLPDYLKHSQILEYVALPTPPKLLKVLFIARENVHRQLRAASHDVKFQLRSILSKLQNIPADQLSFLLALPIFQAVDGKSFIGCHVDSVKLPVASRNFSLPEGVQILDRKKVISSSEEESFRLLNKLGMRIETTGSLLMPQLQRYLACPAYSEQEKNKLMLWILERMEILGAETANFTDFLRQLPFVATASGRRKVPRELFDHSDQLLSRLLIDYPDAFPAKEFSEPMKKRKSDLQVRCRSNLTAQDLLKIINVNSSSPGNVLMRGNALLELIKQRPELLDGNRPLIDGLRNVAWLPRVMCRPDSYPEFVPWYNGKSVCEPKDMCPSSVAVLVGASVPLFDENILTRKIQDSLGISSNVKFSKVVEQLQFAIVSWNSQQHQPSGMPLAKFQNLLKNIYYAFSQRPANDVQQFVREARLSEWIWHGDGFTSPNKVALLARFPKSINLHPHLFLLPKEFHSLKEFLFAFGVKKEFTDDDLLSVLGSIKAKHDNAKQNDEDVIQDLDLCRAVLEWLVRDGNSLSENIRSNLLVPVDTPTGQLRLELCNECTYCDREFLRQGGSESNFTIDSHLIHKAIPDHLASSLDVPRLSSCLAGAQPLGYMIEEAGQYEPITTRIRNILQQYKEGVAIFKEIIQNADDAGASKVCFVVDWRESPRKKLLSDELAKCQGPALWAYNNAMFSKKDFENINKLAGETKKEELDKVGRFGLGFNAVYHLTDVPSFISGENFVVFDPNIYHIAKVFGRTGGSRPGMKINLATSRQVLSLFPDQFLPYNDLFGCNTTSAEPGTFHFEGTLFRFPFRTDEQARRSELSQDPYTKDHMRNVLDSLKESASTLLLFAQNVKKVRVFEIPRNSHPKNALGEPIISILKEVEILLHSNCADRDGKGTFIRNCSNWFSNQGNAMYQDEDAQGPRRTELLKISVSVKESMVGDTIEARKQQDTWLVNSCYGSGASLQVAESDNGRKHSLLPITGAAVKISQNKPVDEFTHESKVLPVNGEVFCFMPLSIASGLPVHVNGYFSVYSNRRRLWEEGVGERQSLKPFEALWNEALMEDALAQVYLQLLELIKSHAGKQYVFHSLWPNPTAISNAKAWKPFINAFFNKIIDEQWALFYCNKEWRALDNCYILDAKLSKVSECLSIMNILGVNVLSLPEVKLEAFRSSGKADVITQHTLTEGKFLRNFFFPNIARLPNELRDSVLCHVLDRRLRKHWDYDDLLKKYHCISCSKDGKVLRRPSELVHPDGKVACLFSDEEEKFPTDARFLTKERAMMLQDLGMIVDRLSWDGVCGRAEWISSHCNKERHRASHLVHYLNEFLKSSSDFEPTMKEKGRLSAARFLPFLKKPQEYPFPNWKASKLTPNQLVSANVLYTEHSKLLVGASQLILDESSQGFGPLNKTLKSILGLSSKEPQLQDVLIQLDHVTEHLHSLASNSAEKTEASCSTMYSFFQKIATSDKHKSKRTNLRSELERRSWMLVKGRMITPKRVAMKWDKADGSPYLFSLPPAYTARFSGLIKWYGVKQNFTADDFLQAIWKLRDDVDGKKLSDQQLKVLLAFLEEVCDTRAGLDLTNLKKPLPLPDNDGILHDAAKLAIHDAPWMEPDGTIRYVHVTFPPLVAYKCGAKELRNAVLSNCSVPIGQPFGQSELLTDRLNGILESYPPDEGILKELVQNADDAKAKEIHFVFDPRTHGSERIFSDKWKELQGPAICVYNDQPFSEEDIEGIQNLGIGSKINDAEKTGQYGIGFNAVYHLTDCPCFLSNDSVICVSDPHHYYVPGATAEKPGRLYNQLNKKFRKNFEEVLIGFLGDIFTLRGGTMFRLPLRQDGGLQSKISKKSWGETEIRHLLKMFRCSAKEMLLFLNNVSKISISEIKNGTLETYSVLCTVSDEGERSNFLEKIKQYKRTPTHEIPWHVIHYTMNLSDTNKVKQDWLVSQSLGCIECSNDSIPDGSRMGLLPRAGIAARLPSSDPSYVPALSYRAFCFLPLPVTTNLRVHVNGHFALDSARRDIWHDPKNADYRMLWNEFVKRKVVAATYASLISEARAVIRGLRHDSDLKGHFTSEKDTEIGLNWYHDLFPDIELVDEKWKSVVEALYIDCLPNFSVLPVAQSVPERKKRSLSDGILSSPTQPSPQEDKPVQVDWYNVSEAYFCPANKWDSWSLEKSLLDVGIPLLSHTPKKIYAGFGEKAKEVHPEAVTEFLRAHSPLVDQLPRSVKDTMLLNRHNVHALIKYCSEGKDFFENLDGVPLLLTQDEVLRCFSVDASVFCSRFSQLVPSNPELFLHEIIRVLFVSNIKKCSSIVKEFDIPHLSKFKNDLFPSTWSNSTTHQPWDPSTKSGSIPSKEWLELLWDFIHDVSSKKEESDVLQSISTWPIIPTTRSCLVPVSMSKTVLNVSSFLNDDSFVDGNRRRLLVKLGCSELQKIRITSRSYSFVNSTGSEAVLKHYLALVQSAKDVLGLLNFALNKNGSQGETNLSDQEIENLLMFLQSDVSSLPGSLLLKLPFYQTISRKYTRLSTSSTIYEVPDDLPLQDLQVLADIANCVVLRQAPKLRDLYKYIGIQQASSVHFYLHIILKYFNHLTPVGRECHLKYIRDYLLPVVRPNQQDHDKLISTLRELPFIPDHSGALHRACEFYDPQNKVFLKFVPRQNFPPKPFDSEDWEEFLHDVGLQSVVKEEHFLEYAIRVQGEVCKPAEPALDKEISEMSQVLVSYLFENLSLHDRQFLLKISKVKFVLAAKIKDILLHQIHPIYKFQPERSKSNFIIFRGSVVARHVSLVWSTAPLLSYSATPEGKYREDLVEKLGIHTKPPHELVVSHAKNISGLIHETKKKQIPPHLRFTFCSVMDKLYDHFKKCCKETSSPGASCSQECVTACNALRDVPIVLVGEHTLVRGNQLSFSLASTAVQPYMFEVPRRLVQYEHFLKGLGTQEFPTPIQYATVLQAIKDSLEDKEMHPVESMSALAAVRGLFACLRRASIPSPKRATVAYDEGQSLVNISVLYLPTQDNFLKPSTELVVNDTMEQKDRLKEHWKNLLVDFTMKDQDPPDKLVQLLPDHLKVQKLSSKIREELNPDCINKVCVLDNDSSEGTCDFIKRYRHIMCSSELSQAMIRLYRNQEKVAKVPEVIQKDLKAMETRLKISCMQVIETRLVSKTTEKAISDSKAEASCFCRDDHDGFTIMIKHGGEKNASILYEKLSSFIHKITGRRIHEANWRYLMMILGAKEPSEISSVLDAAKIPRNISNIGKEPCPGDIIPEHFHFLLKNDIDYYLRDGELVAYELEEEDGNNDAVYVFAKIIEQTNEGGGRYGFDSRYKIDVGQEEPIEVSKLKLYKFDRDGTKVKKEKKTSSTELVLYEGPEAESDTTEEEKKTTPKPCNLEDAKKEVAEALKEIWNLPESERSSAIKRLIRRWHPDKNQDCEALANEVTKFLFNEVERLKKGGVPGYTAPGSRRPNSSTGPGSRPRSTWDGPDFSDFFRSYQQRARRERQRYHDWRGRSQEHADETEPANKNEAERWMRQAREDVNAATFLFQSQQTSFYTFTCFHCQQAVEKCLKALLFAKGHIEKSDLDTHDVMSYAYRVSSEDESLRCLPQLVKDIHSYYTKTRYPEYIRYFPNERIPSEIYTQQNAADALSKTREILQLIRDVLN